MDNFKTSKHKRRGRHSSVDGIVKIKKSNVEPTSGLVGDFKQKDGFHPYEQSRLGIDKNSRSTIGEDPVAPGDDIAIEPGMVKKRRFLGKFKLWRRKDNPSHKKRNIKKISLITSGVIVLLMLLGAGYAYMKFRGVLKGGAVGAAALDKNVDPSMLRGEGDGRVNILIMGKGGPGHDGPDLTDTLLIASIDTVQNEADILSVPRDFYINYNGSYTKINAVYANAKYAVLNGPDVPHKSDKAERAGFAAIKAAIEKTMGIPIHYQVMVDFEAFRQAIDAVGGIKINVPVALYDPTVAWENNYNPLIAAKGEQTFNGKRALLYAKSRHGSLRGDFDRTERQRAILLALKDRVLSAGTFSNPITVARLINAFGYHVRTDFTESEIMRVYDIAKMIDSSKIKSIGLADPPNSFVTTSNIGGQSVVIPTAGLDNYAAIQSYVRNTLRDGFLRKENARLVVLNGTNNAGLATNKAAVLKSFGYNVTKVGDAPTKNYPNTIVVDLTGGLDKYTRHYLEKRYGVTAVNDLPDKKITITKDQTDFVIIIGQNESIVSQN